MMLRKIRGIIVSLVFLGLLALVFWNAWKALEMNHLFGVYNYRDFYQEKDNSIDVMFYGSSRVFANVNPAVLWEEAGIASYVLGSSNQALWNTYYNMVESLKTQTPKLMMVEVYRVVELRDYEEERIVEATYGMKWGENKKSAILASTPEDKQLAYLLEFPILHTRYTEISQSDFQEINAYYGQAFKGFFSYYQATPFETLPDITSVTEVRKMTDKNEEYLRKIIGLAKEHKIPLVLYVAPYAGVNEMDKAFYNYAEGIATSEEILFVDYNEQFQQIGLDGMTDFAEISHLNYRGNTKFTKYLASFIDDQFDLEDHRGNPEYADWDLCLEEWTDKVSTFEMLEQTTMFEYISRLKNNPNYTIVVWLQGMNSIENVYIRQAVEEFGIHLKSYNDGGVWVYSEEEWAFAAAGVIDDYVYHQKVGSSDLMVTGNREVSKTETGQIVVTMKKTINLNRKNYEVVEHGINILVYDDYEDRLVDVVAFDTMNGYAMTRP